MLPVDAGRDGPEENGYSILLEVQHLLDGMEFEETHASDVHVSLDEPPEVTARRLGSLLTNVQGKHWRKCTIERHTMPDGCVVWTAARMCPLCSSTVGHPVVHTFVAQALPDGSFDFAAPQESEES